MPCIHMTCCYCLFFFLFVNAVLVVVMIIWGGSLNFVRRNSSLDGRWESWLAIGPILRNHNVRYKYAPFLRLRALDGRPAVLCDHRLADRRFLWGIVCF